MYGLVCLPLVGKTDPISRESPGIVFVLFNLNKELVNSNHCGLLDWQDL
jgi:hypothetical protein